MGVKLDSDKGEGHLDEMVAAEIEYGCRYDGGITVN